MAKNKTENTNEDVIAFVNAVESEQKRNDSHSLIALMSEISGEHPKMFGPTIVGFGNYHYKYDSGHEGTAPLLGFSPRKAAFSLYVFTGLEEHKHLLEGLGKFKIGKACIYVNKLSDIDEGTLIRLMEASIDYISNKYTRISS